MYIESEYSPRALMRKSSKKLKKNTHKPENKHITVWLLETRLESIDEIVEKGWYANRSELIRDAIDELLSKHGIITQI